MNLPQHPGVILLTEFMEPCELSSYKLAKDIGVNISTILQLTAGKRRITPYTARKLALYFLTPVDYWLNLQTRYDCRIELTCMMREEGDRD